MARGGGGCSGAIVEKAGLAAEVQFDTEQILVEQLELRRGGEFVIDCMSSIEDTKGNNGESGELRVFCADQFPHGVALEYVRAAGAGPVRSLILSTAVCR